MALQLSTPIVILHVIESQVPALILHAEQDPFSPWMTKSLILEVQKYMIYNAKQETQQVRRGHRSRIV